MEKKLLLFFYLHTVSINQKMYATGACIPELHFPDVAPMGAPMGTPKSQQKHQGALPWETTALASLIWENFSWATSAFEHL